MSVYKSSNSLQNSTPSFSFTRTNKFEGIYKKTLSQNIYNIPMLKSTRQASQGYGVKSDLMSKIVKDTPAPNSYRLKSCFENAVDNRKGPLILERFTPMVIFLFLFFSLWGIRNFLGQDLINILVKM